MKRSRLYFGSFHNRLRYGKGHNTVIRSKATFAKELKVFAAMIFEFKTRTYDIADNCTDHLPPSILQPAVCMPVR